MIFKKNYGELVQQSLSYLVLNTGITNTNIGGITRSLIEIINKNISEYYDVLDLNMAMGFLSTAEGYFLDLIGELFNLERIQATNASWTEVESKQKFYVSSGVLYDRIPSGFIPANTTVSSQDGSISYNVTSDTNFAAGVKEVYVPISANSTGSKMNVGINILTSHNLGISDVFTTNSGAIVSGTDTESDSNYRYRLMNATVSAEKANEIAIRLAALSVEGVADVVIKPYSRGIGTYDIIVIPVEGIAGDNLITNVQSAIEAVQAYGIKGTAIKPGIVSVNIEVKIVFINGVTEFQQSEIRALVQSSIEKYIVNIPIGSSFILNELRQQIMDVSPKIKDHVINCYMFRGDPVFIGNYDIYWDELFYPDTSLPEAIRVI